MDTSAQKIIRKGCMSYEMIAGHDSRAGIDFIRFSGRSSVRAFLSGFLKDYFNIIMLRQVVQEGATGSYLRLEQTTRQLSTA